MELSAVWTLITLTILRACRVNSLLPIPLIILEDRIQLNSETKVSCVLPASECRCLEVELKIVTTEKLKNCVSHKGNYSNVTCTLDVTKEMNEMELSCEAHFRTKSKPYKLNIQTEPEFTDCPDKLVWIEGQEASFHCKAKGYPPPNVTCQKDSMTYKEGETFITVKNMSGSYTCRAVNFDSVGKKVTVSVEYEPEILSIAVEPAMSVYEGANVTLTCKADGVPSPVYSWHPQVPHVILSGDNKTLQIREVTSVHDGFYICIVQNKHGIKTQQQKIVVNKDIIEAQTNPALFQKGKGEKLEVVFSNLLLLLLSSSLFYYLC
ncbi:intercellular adhesion molecule 5-like [Hyperolius riggenbachi]|uniref:intercellular adhesion molecule 5-like n=1 Tax=Hyperolius riggenbachi TaxID=752182 RepID=UPI0035A29190